MTQRVAAEPNVARRTAQIHALIMLATTSVGATLACAASLAEGGDRA